MSRDSSSEYTFKNKTFAELDQLTQDSFARLTNKMVWASKRLRDFGTGELLSQAEIELIDRVVKGDELSVTLIAQQLGVTKSAISQLASNLTKKGYLSTVASPDHGKIRFLKPTKKALITSRGLDQYRNKLSAYLKDATKAELAAHLKVSARIEAFLSEIQQEE